MEQSVAFANTAALLADPSRAAMLLAMLDGKAYTAKELARAARVTPQTASFHLDKMLNARLLEVLRQGRHRYFRLADSEVASTLESVLVLQNTPSPEQISSGCPPQLHEARTCFDHIAGKLGVRLYRACAARGWVTYSGSEMAVTDAAGHLLDELGIRREYGPIGARPCLDWSERDFHFSGDFGRFLLHGMIEQRWVLRGKARALTLTEKGARRLKSWGM